MASDLDGLSTCCSISASKLLLGRKKVHLKIMSFLMGLLRPFNWNISGTRQSSLNTSKSALIPVGALTHV